MKRIKNIVKGLACLSILYWAGTAGVLGETIYKHGWVNVDALMITCGSAAIIFGGLASIVSGLIGKDIL